MISGEHGIEPSGKYVGTDANQLDHANVYYNQVVLTFRFHSFRDKINKTIVKHCENMSHSQTMHGGILVQGPNKKTLNIFSHVE